MTDSAPETEDVKFFRIQEGQRGRDGGPYLDVEEQRFAEELRARVEGREPDFDNMGAAAGTVLVTSRQLPDNVWSNPSQAENVDFDQKKADAIESALVDNEALTPVELPVSTTSQAEVDAAANENAVGDNAQPTAGDQTTGSGSQSENSTSSTPWSSSGT